MAGDWPSVSVSDLESNRILLVQDGNHGEYRPRSDEFVASGVAFIRAADMADGRVLFESAAKINNVAFNRITKGIGQPGDVLLSHKGTVGKVAIVPMDCPAFVCSPQTTFWRTLDQGVLDRSYLYSYLRGQHFHDQLATRSAETDMAPYVSLTSQRGLSVIVPPVAVQRAIGRILKAIDDKIELNRRMNATLEGIARAIFKSWFVDFDPVRQKAAGKQPIGMDAQTAALFPDSFEESEIGEVPTGWRALALPEVADIMSGGTPRKSDAAFWGGDIPWVSPKGMTHIHVDDSIDRVTQAAVGNGTRLVPAGAVLVMVRGMGLHDGVRVSQAKCPVTFNQDVKALVATGIPSTHLLYWLLHEASSLLAKVQTSGHGTGVLPTEFLNKLMVVIPDSNDVLNRLVACLEGLDAQLFALVTQEKTLAALRDTLLPKLLSGEVRVPEAEESVEEAIA